MTDDLFIAHNPAGVWQVPDTFRSIYSHAVEVGNPYVDGPRLARVVQRG
jgi:hypothetical protein